MFYLAIGLVLVGVALILYYVFADADEPRAQGLGQPAPRSEVRLPGAHGGAAPVSRPPDAATQPGAAGSLYRAAPARIGSERLPTEPAGPPPLALQGSLFLKPDGRSLDAPDLLRDGERLLGAVRRVGEATLLVEHGRFLIRAGDASFSYSSHDLEEVRFEQGGFSFIPVDRSRPVPVFLTEAPDELRDYLRTHSVSGPR